MLFLSRTLSGIFKKIGENTKTNGLKPCSLNLYPYKDSTASLCNKRYFSTALDEGADLNYDEITNGNKELETKLKVIALEAEVMRQDGKAVPEHSFLKNAHWQELLNLSSRTARQKYLEYLFKLSKKSENKKAKSEERRKSYEEHLEKRQAEKASQLQESLEEFALKYDLAHNNIFLRFYDTTMNMMYNNRLVQAMQFGQKVVVDLGYDANMTKRENLNCAKQLMLLFAENRAHDDPFDIHFCNANKQSVLMKQFYKFIPTIDEPWFPLNLHECSYLDIFPKRDLVYLTPHSRDEIEEFDHDAIYIIGAIVDKVNQEPLSFAKAKREGITMKKFPLDRYLQWGAGSGKSLTLNQVAAILLDQKVSGNWDYALRHVPRRKLFHEGSTLKAMDRVYSRNRINTVQRKWMPTYNVNFDDRFRHNRNNFKNDSPKLNRAIDVKDIFNE